MVSDLKFIDLDELSYLKFREPIIELYFQAFTTGEYAQYLEKKSVVNTMDELVYFGTGVLALSVDRIVGVLAATPLTEHIDLPINYTKAFTIDKTIYINEVIVDKEFRGRGIAEKMITLFLDNISEKYHNAVIRVWDKNIPALSLYSKLNFKPITRIRQTKLKTQNEEFQMEKIYLYKKLITNNR